MNARDLFLGDSGDHLSVAARIVVFRWHDACRQGCYIVHVQPSVMCSGLMSDSGVFASGDTLRHAVVDDFGTLRGVS